MSEITSDTEICNLALQRIGEVTITSLDQGTAVAERCKLAYPQARDAMLRMHPWNFAIKRAQLATTTAPTWQYTYAHQLPSDYLRLLWTNLDTSPSRDSAVENVFPVDNPNYRVEGKTIVSNEATVQVEYIARLEDISKYDDLFIDALIARLSAELAAASKKSITGVGNLWRVANEKLAAARLVDSQEGTPRTWTADVFLQSRF